MLLAPSCDRILKLVCLLWILQSQDMCWQPPLCFPESGAKLWSLPGPQIQSHQLFAKARSCCHQNHRHWVRHGCVGEAHEVLEVPVGRWRDLRVRHPQWRMGRPPHGVSRICAPFKHSSPLFMQFMTHEREVGLFGSIPHSWGSWALNSHTLTSLHEEILG